MKEINFGIFPKDIREKVKIIFPKLGENGKKKLFSLLQDGENYIQTGLKQGAKQKNFKTDLFHILFRKKIQALREMEQDEKDTILPPQY